MIIRQGERGGTVDISVVYIRRVYKHSKFEAPSTAAIVWKLVF